MVNLYKLGVSCLPSNGALSVYTCLLLRLLVAILTCSTARDGFTTSDTITRVDKHLS